MNIFLTPKDMSLFLLLIVVCCESSASRHIGYQEVAVSPASELVRAPPLSYLANISTARIVAHPFPLHPLTHMPAPRLILRRHMNK